MAFSSAFQSVASDAWGEPIRMRVYIRLAGSAAGVPGDLLTVTEGQSVISANAMTRRRELKFGTIQGHSWQIRTTNIDRALLDYDFKGCWIAVYGGFSTADEWDVFAQGRVFDFQASTDGTVTFDFQDTLMDILGYELTRDMGFFEDGWVSQVQRAAGADPAGSYSSSTELILNDPDSAADETFVIEFTGSTEFKIVLEDGDDSQTGYVGSDTDVDNAAGAASVVTIPSSGWTGDFEAGDKFEFFTSRKRTSAELTPVNMIRHLVEDVVGIGVYSALSGLQYGSVFFDADHWGDVAEIHLNKPISGDFPRGTKVSAMIQDALKLIHGSVYPSRTGQLCIWDAREPGSGGISLNGNPSAGQVDIEGAVYSDPLEPAVSAVTYSYFAPDGSDAEVSLPATGGSTLVSKTEVVDIAWRTTGLVAQDAAQKYVARFRDGTRVHTVNTALKGILADIASPVTVTEGELGMVAVEGEPIEVAPSLFDGRAQLKMYSDPIVHDNYFTLGESLLGGEEVLG